MRPLICFRLSTLFAMACLFPCLSQAQAPALGKEQLVLAGQQIQKSLIALDSTGRPHVVSDQGRRGRKMFYSYFTGQAWVDEPLHRYEGRGGIVTEPELVINRQDTGYLSFWRWEGDEGWHAGFYPITDMSHEPQVGALLDLGHGASPLVDLDAQDRLHVTWRAPNGHISHQIFPRDGNPGPVRDLTATPVKATGEAVDCGSGMDADIDEQGVLHLVCADHVQGLLYVNTARAERREPVELIAPPWEVGCIHEWSELTLAVDRKQPDRIYVAFNGADNHGYFFIRKDGRWQGPLHFAPMVFQHGEKRAPPFVAALPEGGALLAWMDNRRGEFEVYLNTISADGEWGRAKRITRGKNARFALGRDDTIHLVFTRDENVYYLRLSRSFLHDAD